MQIFFFYLIMQFRYFNKFYFRLFFIDCKHFQFWLKTQTLLKSETTQWPPLKAQNNP